MELVGCKVDLVGEPVENPRVRVNVDRIASVPSRYDPADSLADVIENTEQIERCLAGVGKAVFAGNSL
ncbi:MAG: hypothetical protein HIU82_00160 [Proteobacteria bacterium]|nr:hypothetical protein [Pseudomonadota bacterium]